VGENWLHSGTGLDRTHYHLKEQRLTLHIGLDAVFQGGNEPYPRVHYSLSMSFGMDGTIPQLH